VPHTYIAIMKLPPAVAYEGDITGLEATRPGKGKKINPKSAHVKKYMDFLQKSHDDALVAAGTTVAAKVYSYTVALNGVAAALTEAQAEALARQPGVASVKLDAMRYATTDTSPTFLGLAGNQGVWAKGIDGEGVIIGVIDTGIWPEHPSFHDDGSFGPPPIDVAGLPCDFGNAAFNPDDAPFTCNNKLLGARTFLNGYKADLGLEPEDFDSARDSNGHGTHTASTAGGNHGVEASILGIPRGMVSGIAPRARIIAYRGLGSFGRGVVSDLAAAIDQAVADGVDVINYSIGGLFASLTDPDDVAFLFAADAGVFVAVSAGNAGPSPESIPGPASVPWLTAAGASTHDRAFLSDITVSGPGTPPADLWGGSVTEGVEDYDLVDAAGIVDSEGKEFGGCENPFLPGTFQPTDAVVCSLSVFGPSSADRAENVAAGGGGAVLFQHRPDTAIPSNLNSVLPTVHMLHDVAQPVRVYLAANPGQVTVGFTQGTARYAAEDPRVTADVVARFSSRGPDEVAPDIIKPDITAPGVNVLAGASPIHLGAEVQGELFQAISGTSMASPHVAGAFALIKQAHPDWSPAMARSALMTTAYQAIVKQDGATPATPFDRGAGRLNPDNKGKKGSAFQPGLTYDAGYDDYLGFLCDAAPEAVENPETTCADLRSSGVPTEAYNLNLPSIGVAEVVGAQTVWRTVTSVAQDAGRRMYSVSVDAPPGYQVTVSPSTLPLMQGESAVYQVTFLGDCAAANQCDQWRFGGVTWRDVAGQYEAHTPIAVRAALFDWPEEISASGESGTESFDVRFGYTGSYTAAARGLVGATVTSGNVTEELSTSHEFILSNVAHFRVALPPGATEADADLDVFVRDPTGSTAAASLGEGSIVRLDIARPMDGIWTVEVRGNSTPGGDSDYDLYTWALPLTSGGTLTIDSAPAAATVGETGTVDVSWGGAASGAWYIGSVTHTGDTGLMGVTFIDVDNR
jgi:subtilisin family serine protease